MLDKVEVILRLAGIELRGLRLLEYPPVPIPESVLASLDRVRRTRDPTLGSLNLKLDLGDVELASKFLMVVSAFVVFDTFKELDVFVMRVVTSRSRFSEAARRDM